MSRKLFSLALSLFIVLSVAVAQVDTGTISGTVKDQSGSVIPGAVVKVENRDTGISVSLVTNATGFYSAPDLKAGIYQISVASPGFQSLTKTGIELRVQDRVPVDFDLQIGQASTAVSVEADIPALQTETS